MLRLSKKADYALISLAYMAERGTQIACAREIAETCQLPLALLMNILKAMHQRGLLRSVRGASGGYQIAADLTTLTLLDLSNLLDGAFDKSDGDHEPVGKRLALHAPAQALQYRLVRFMKDVSVADLVMPGRRIDVPLERVSVNNKHKHRPQPELISHS